MVVDIELYGKEMLNENSLIRVMTHKNVKWFIMELIIQFNYKSSFAKIILLLWVMY